MAVAPKVDTSTVASLSVQPSSGQSPDLRPVRTAPSMSGATVGVRPSSPKLDMPTKRPGKITNRVVAGNAKTTAPSAAPDTQSELLAKPAKPEEANAPAGAQPAVQPAVAQAASPEAAKQPPNSLLEAIGGLCQSNGRSSACGATRPPPSDIQAARVRHSVNVAERLCL